MRIGFFTSMEGWGGSELYLLTMAEAVWEAGYAPVMFGVSDTRMEQECCRRRIPFVAWKRHDEDKLAARRRCRATMVLPSAMRLLLGNLQEALGLRRLLRHVGLDIMHINVHGYEVAGLACQLAKIPCVGVYATSPVRERNTTRRWLIKWTMRTYDRLVTKSCAAAQAWSVETGIPTERFTVIWNDVDTVRFSPSDSGRRPASKGILRLVSVGRLHPMKGYRYVIEAMSLIQDCDVTLTIVGDGEVRTELMELAGLLGVGERVRFLGHRDDVVPVLREADAFVLASVSHEAFPSAVTEAMACGLPVVTSDFGPFREINQHGTTGLVVPVTEAEALARAIRELAMDPARREAMGHAARDRAVSCFGTGGMARQTIGQYEEVVTDGFAMAVQNKEPLRVGYFTSVEGWGGSESYLLGLMSGVKARGHVPVLFGVGGTRLIHDARLAGIEAIEWKEGGVNPWKRKEVGPRRNALFGAVVAFAPGWLLLLAGVLREIQVVRAKLRSRTIDILHVNVSGYEVASFAAWLEGIPSLAMCMTSPVGESSPLRRALTRWSLRNSSHVGAQSRACAEAWKRETDLDGRRVSFVWNGVDTARFAVEDVVRQRNAKDPFRLVSVGRLHPMKGHHVLVEAMRILGDLRIFLQIVGEGELDSTLLSQIEAAGLQNNIRMSGHCERPEELLRQAHAFALASISHESGPAAVAEAMAAGLPVISSDYGPLAEINLDGITGVVAPVGDSGAMARAIRWMADNPDVCLKMGRASREHAVRYFSQDRMIERTVELYRSVRRFAAGGCACGAEM